MEDSTQKKRRWTDSTSIIYGVFFLLYGCVAAWAGVTHHQIGQLDDRLRVVEIQQAEMRSDVRAIRGHLESIERKLESIR